MTALERTLPRAAYLDAEIFGLERERIFTREWVCVGRAESVAGPGEYVVIQVAGESVLLVRGRDAVLRAFYNVCRHRGCELVLTGADAPAVPESTGSSGTFATGIRCPYHSWTYSLDGSLRSAPFLEEGEGFARADLPLHSVDVDTWGGFVFVRLATDGEGGPLLEQLGEGTRRLERYPWAELRTSRRIAYDVAANWKVILENYNECYHCAGVHPELCAIVPAFKHRGGAELDWEGGIPQASGTWTFTKTGTSSRSPFRGLSDDERVRHKGELFYPNLLISASADHAAAFTLWPRGAERTTVACDFLFHEEECAKPAFDPSDALEFWDIVNRQDWAICEGVQRGMRSRVFETGFYAPMESWSLDIRRYIRSRLGTRV
jgi:glycine betaine catabolism A